ncbi:flagellar filament capping protein FliD [Clostridium lundense]|uniref:flagellar filament capping protein FliD n=1 Tax=Clostridium lundense TaxID=319475 RepID=UPI00047F65AC|nr:flagellar filament capping protein FliD [Clostridium lundense]
MADSISGLSGTGGGDMMRVIGMASGMDIDGMIKKMMLAEQKKVDVVKQQRQAIVWKQEMYQDIIKDVKDLQNTYFGATSADCLISSKAYSDFKVDSTNSAIAAATATTGAVSGNYSVKVEQLAKGAAFQCGIAGDLNTEMKSTGKITLTLDGKNVDVNFNATDTIKDFINNVKNAKWDDGTLVGNDVDVSYSELTQKFTIVKKKTGAVADATKDLNVSSAELSFNKNQNSQDAIVHITPPGGTETKVTQSRNNFTIDGIAYNLQSQSEVIDPNLPREANNLSATTLTVTKDADKTFDRFVKFIDKYNSLIDKINTKLTEKKDYDYKPLTDDQKKGMKDDEIKAWEEKAKKGILRNDDNLRNMLSHLRSTFFDPVNEASASFGKSIGLDTDGKASKAGQIKFSDDTGDTFKKALSERADEIMDLFNKTYTLSSDDLTKSSEEQKKIMYDNSGIFQRISTILNDNVGTPGITINSAILTKYANKQEDYSIYGTAGSNTLPDQIYKKDNLIKTLNSKLKDKENSLYKKFSALEVVMNKYNAQTSWLAQQFQ